MELKQEIQTSVEVEKLVERPSTASVSSSSKSKSSSVTNLKKISKQKRKRETDSDVSSEYDPYEPHSRPTKGQAAMKKEREDRSTQCEQIVLSDIEKSTTIIALKVRKNDAEQDDMMIVETVSASPARKELYQHKANNHIDTGEEAEMTLEIINYHSRNGDGNSGDSSNCSAPLSLPGSENSSRSDHDGSDSPSDDAPTTELPVTKVTKPQQPSQPQSVVACSSFTSTVSVALPSLVIKDPRATLQKQLFRHQYVPLYSQAQRAPLPSMNTTAVFTSRRPLQYHPDMFAMGTEQGGTTYRLGSNGAVLKNEEKK